MHKLISTTTKDDYTETRDIAVCRTSQLTRTCDQDIRTRRPISKCLLGGDSDDSKSSTSTRTTPERPEVLRDHERCDDIPRSSGCVHGIQTVVRTSLGRNLSTIQSNLYQENALFWYNTLYHPQGHTHMEFANLSSSFSGSCDLMFISMLIPSSQKPKYTQIIASKCTDRSSTTFQPSVSARDCPATPLLLRVWPDWPVS